MNETSILVRLSEQEKEKWDTEAKKRNIKTAKLIRDAVNHEILGIAENGDIRMTELVESQRKTIDMLQEYGRTLEKLLGEFQLVKGLKSELAGLARATVNVSDIDLVVDWLNNAGSKATVAEIVAGTGLSESIVSKALETLQDDGRVRAFTKPGPTRFEVIM